MKRPLLLLLLILTLLLALPLLAEGGTASGSQQAGFLTDFLADFDRTSKRLVDLAGAIPADTYDWRPTDKVRTLSQACMHVASTNFYLARDLGVA